MEITDFILKYGTRINELQGVKAKPLQDYSFKKVKIKIPTLLENGDFEGVAKCLLKLDKVENSQELLNFILWVKDELTEINERENKTLSTHPDIEMIQAGIHRLNQFGLVGTLESLSTNILDWKKLLKLSYYDVYVKLLLNKTTNDIQKNYHKIITEKSKAKK